MSKSNYEQIQELLDSSKKDAEKFFNKGNATAGTRLRMKMSEISKKCFDVRKDVQLIKKTPALGDSDIAEDVVSEF